jgi:hemerythrin superfamily protein
MVTTLNDTKRQAIGQKLADMKAIQENLIANEEKLMSSCTDSDVRKRLQNMLEDDRKNIGVLETVMVEYGVPAQPHDSTQKMVEQAQAMMESSDFSLFEKAAQHELLKHAQVASGLVIHKCAQVVGADVQEALSPLNTINFENRAHQEQLKGILEVLGTRELTGQEPEQGLWGRVQDALSALSGVVGSGITRTKDDVNIIELLQTEHRKVDTLFKEIENSDNPQKVQEYFGQLYKDLVAHSKAEEEVVYPVARNYYDDTQELYDEQAEMRRLLDEIKSLSPGTSDFNQRIQTLKSMVQEHVDDEEDDMLPKMRRKLSEEQMEELATQFKDAKSRCQQEMA